MIVQKNSCLPMARISEVLLFLLFLFDISSQTCNECDCCYGENSCDADKKCSNGCIAGFWGNKCTESCPENCKTCESSITCTECHPGYHGNQCTFECGKGCLNNTCLQSGECTCKSSNFKGRYCSSCSSSNNYGDACNYTCPPYCGACQSQTVCSWCKNFFAYGSYCQFTCSVGCVSGTCSKDGSCLTGCKPGYTGEKCDSCVSGKFGQNCDLDCPSNCTSCLSNSNCTECELGFYGQTCANVCSPGCHGECSVANGKCVECKQGLYGDYCNETCADGMYGINCSKACKNVDQFCLNCIAGKSGFYVGCLNCASGYFPFIPFNINFSLCRSCPSECKNNVCHSTGLCTNGCVGRKWGRTCKSDCSMNCLECNQVSGKCIKCNTGRYSDDCSKLCSTNCSSVDGQQVCEFQTGECIDGCGSFNTYGKYCEHKCSETCINQTCNWKTGHCSYGCVQNYHGSFCENRCASTCKAEYEKSSCNDSTGFCFSGCEHGFYGNMCESKCKAQQESITTGELVGIVFGSVLIGGLFGGTLTLVFIMWKRRNARKRKENDDNKEVNYENDIPVTYEDLKARDERTYSQINTDRHISPQTAEYVNC